MKDLILLIVPIICGGIVIWDNFGKTKTKEFIRLTCTAILTAGFIKTGSLFGLIFVIPIAITDIAFFDDDML